MIPDHSVFSSNHAFIRDTGNVPFKTLSQGAIREIYAIVDQYLRLYNAKDERGVIALFSKKYLRIRYSKKTKSSQTIPSSGS